MTRFFPLINMFKRRVERPRHPRHRVNLRNFDQQFSLYAVGDIHGCLKELHDAEARILSDISRQQRPGIVVFLGDYVDRGPQSAGVIDHFCQPQPEQFRRLPLCGNHDQLFLDFMSDPRRHQGWIGVGGRETLQSYAIDSERYLKSGDFSGLRNAMLKNIPPHHVAFLERLAICAQTPTHLFVHAGLRPGRALENQTDSDLMWIREPFLSKGPQLPITVVHGHTMTAQPVFEKQRIGIDTGAFMTGNLTVVRIFGGACEVI